MMMVLGVFVFSLSTLAYQDLQRTREWRHSDVSRIGERAICQFMGPGAEKITLTGLLVPEFGSPLSLGALTVMASTGLPYPLVDGLGHVHGSFVIESLTDNQTYFTRVGTAQRIEFTLTLKRVENIFDYANLPTLLSTGISKARSYFSSINPPA